MSPGKVLATENQWKLKSPELEAVLLSAGPLPRTCWEHSGHLTKGVDGKNKLKNKKERKAHRATGLAAGVHGESRVWASWATGRLVPGLGLFLSLEWRRQAVYGSETH